MKTKFLYQMTPTQVAIGLLEDAKKYLEQIPPIYYSKTLPLLFDSNIGQHSRHYIEFFQCLLTQAKRSNGLIDYDERKRNQRIEREPKYAIEVIEEIIEALPNFQPNCTLYLQAGYSLDSDEALKVRTCFERELLYNIEHTIHHFAIIKIGLQLVMPEIKLPSHFGIAPSTIKYRNEIQHLSN